MIQQYLVGKSITIGFFFLAFIFSLLFLALIQIPAATIVMIGVCYLLLFCSWLFVSFLLGQRKLQRIEQLIQTLESPYLIGEVLPKPTSLTEQQYFELMKAISHDAITQVERIDKDARDYKDYVEQWIHELKTPLTAMSLVLANEPDVRKLRRELKRADNLTDNILHYARLQTLEKDKQLVQFNVASLLNMAVKNQMDLLIAAKIQVQIDGDFSVFSDQKALQFIVNQFLINSAKYSPASKVRIDAEAHTIRYEDQGIGIPAHEIPRIFERGYTGTNGRTLGTSTGMGLYIVKKLCEELFIDIKVESVVGSYTRFSLTFPNLTKM